MLKDSNKLKLLRFVVCAGFALAELLGSTGEAAAAQDSPAEAPMLSLPELRQQVAQLQALDSLQPRRTRLVPHRGLAIAGWTLFGLSYAPAAIMGPFVGVMSDGSSSYNPEPIPWMKASRWSLLVPVAGPFLSGALGMVGAEKSRDDSYDMELFAWTVPWILVDGVAQVTALALIVASYTHGQLVTEVKAKPEQPSVLSSLRVSPYASPGSAGLVVGGAF